MLARAVIQRFRTDRDHGVTDYFRKGLAQRIETACWQLDRCEGKRVLELGCGRDLLMALVAAIRYERAVIAFDVQRLASLELINFTAQELGCSQAFRRIDDLQAVGIRYVVAPDLTQVDAVDAIVSNAVLEHVPEPALQAMFAFGRRHGVQCIAANIDFADHWSYIEDVDPGHFYYVGDGAWRILNNRRMFQNRLRFSDYNHMATQHGYHLAEHQPTMAHMTIDHDRLTERFRNYDAEDLTMAQALVMWQLEQGN